VPAEERHEHVRDLGGPLERGQVRGAGDPYDAVRAGQLAGEQLGEPVEVLDVILTDDHERGRADLGQAAVSSASKASSSSEASNSSRELPSRASAVTRSGTRSASSSATRPPNEAPTTAVRAMPSSSSR
jgi:hypothetical protein